MAQQQRLIVCLDGTWNLQDDSTNVLHHFNLVLKGDFPGKDGEVVRQKKFYHRGVGTGVLDHVTGGGFGFGLEQNVRDAYDWLVENFHDGAEGVDPDEVYVFGFSRGAYTARSLVGFIGRCGLLRRAAPLSVSQLWDYYGVLQRRREERPIIWDRLFKGDPVDIREITQLVTDPWEGGVPRAGNLTPTEELLVAWSRRVRITYLGVYDTVGAIGWDALAIPGLRSKLAMHHNMRPTTIIQNCRHALALHENRSSFNHTPFKAFIGHGAGGDDGADPKQYWARNHAMWTRKIEQRWFLGAHSNVGGGYANDVLARRPLEWLLERAVKLGLVCEPLPPLTAPLPLPDDSFAQFTPPVWTKILHAKRNYRLIDPEPVPQASAVRPDGSQPKDGFTLEAIHEEVDETVVKCFESSDWELPPNLFEYVTRKLNGKLGARTVSHPRHSWLDGKADEMIALVLWSALVAAGLAGVYKLIRTNPDDSLPWWLLCLVALAAPLIDWGESRANFLRAAGWGVPSARAFLDAAYWTRAFGVVLFACGVVYSVVYLWSLGTKVAGDGAASGQLSEPGLLLLLQFAFFYFLRATPWCGEPLSNANLGSIVKLQLCFSPARVTACLENWRGLLECHWLGEDAVNGPAARRLREVLRETLWRDIIGFIPVYSLAFGFGMWYAAKYCWHVLEPFWLPIALIAAATDYLEDTCHLRYLRLHERGKSPSAMLTIFSFTMSLIKMAAVTFALVVTVGAILCGSYHILATGVAGWRDRTALLISFAYGLVALTLIAGHLVYQFMPKPKW